MFDFKQLLKDFGDEGPWKEVNGPDSRVGVDYWFVSKSGSEANINIDQDVLTLTIDGEMVYSSED